MEISVGPAVCLTGENLYVPQSVFNQYYDLGIHSIFKWQAECLGLDGVLDGRRNLVYSAPTSAGKTLVAELIVLKHVIDNTSKAIIILPFVSVSREKMLYLQKLFTGLGIRVGGFMGGQSPVGGLSAVNVAVCTIEKANGMVNRLIEEGRLDELGVVVVDELHLIGDAHRGYLLELLLTKLLVHSRRASKGSVHQSPQHENQESWNSSLGDQTLSTQCVPTKNGLQIVGMSATLPNLQLLGEWLDAAVYVTTYRPVPLTELVFSRDSRTSVSQTYVIRADEKPVSWTSSEPLVQTVEYLEPIPAPKLDVQLSAETQLNAVDEDGVFGLCLDTMLTGHGVLVFCPTKQWCEQLADSMAKHIFQLTKAHFAAQNEPADNVMQCETIGSRLAAHLNRNGLVQCVEQLRRCPAGLDPALARCLGYAVAFHHAGLTVEERDVVENGFRMGLIRVLVATSTLSSGVNLPARRVIIRTPLFHGHILDYLTYKQMAGRAGRKGVDTSGQSILLCKPRDLPRVRQLISCGMSPVTSCLMSHGGSPESSLRRALLEVIANGFVETVADARIYLSSTLMATSVSIRPTTLSTQGRSNYSRSRRKSLRLSQVKTPSNNFMEPPHSSNKTFLSSQDKSDNVDTEILLTACLAQLQDHELIYVNETDCTEEDCPHCRVGSHLSPNRLQYTPIYRNCARLQPTALGRAVLSSSLGPTHGLVVFEEMDKARRSIALDTDLHLVYLLTPVYLDVGAGLDWFRYLERYQSLPPPDRRVADLIGVEERFITRMAAGSSMGMQRKNDAEGSYAQRLALHRRFYTALALYRLVREDGLATVAEQFGVNRGLLQGLQQQAATYAGMVSIFCNRLGWIHMERLLSSFQSRLFHGVAEELVDLLRLLPVVNAQRARALYSGGYSSVSALANARARDVARLLQRAVPFERSEVSASHPGERRTIPLEDGSFVNEEEAAPIIIQKAQDLLRSDMAHVYGTNVVIITKDKDPKSSPSQSFVSSPHSVQRTTEIAPQAVPFATEQQKQEENEKEEKHEADGGSCTSVSDKSTEDSGFTKVSVDSSFSPSCQRVGKKNTKYVSEESHNVPCALSTPSTHLIGCKEPGSITTRSSQSPADTMRSHFGRPQFKRPVTPDLIGAFTPPIKRREISASQPSVSFSQVEETFVLTTQLAALVDNVRPDIPGTLDSHTESGKSEIESPLENADADDFVPLSAFDYEMNDTLTLSMLDNVCGSYSIHSEGRKSNSSTGEIVVPVRDPFSAKKAERSRSRLSDLFGSPLSPDDTADEGPVNPILSPLEIVPESQLQNINPELNTSHESLLPKSAVPTSEALFSVVNVTQTARLWQTFLKDIHNWLQGNQSSTIAIQPCWVLVSSKEHSFSLTWRSGPAGCPKHGGGVEMDSKKHPTTLALAGLAISAAGLRPKTVFWLDLFTLFASQSSESEEMGQIQRLLCEIHQPTRTVVVWDAKWWLRVLKELFAMPISPEVCLFDPGLIGWLCDPDRGRPSLIDELSRLHLESDFAQLETLKSRGLSTEPPTQFCDWYSQMPQVETDVLSSLCPPTRTLRPESSCMLAHHVNQSTTQCFLLHQWTRLDRLLECHSPKVFIELELPCSALLANIESYGFAVNIPYLVECREKLISHSQLMEQVAYRLVGRPFRLDSPKEIAQVLFQWLRLPQLTDASDHIAAKRRSHLALLSGKRALSSRSSSLPRATNALLTRLSALHPLPGLIIEWRHVHGVLEKSFDSLVSTCVLATKDSRVVDNSYSRLAPIYDVYTSTGRIVSCLPNIQAVPNDIQIDYPHIRLPREANAIGCSDQKKSVPSERKKWPYSIQELLTELPEELVVIRPRLAFCVPEGSMLISGDYCQLELRLLAHFSRDTNLLDLLGVSSSVTVASAVAHASLPPEQDAFRRLAAHWLKLSSTSEVTPSQRQQAKQLCYAVIYGMGAQGLASQLDISEGAAQNMIDSFLRAFPGVQCFIRNTIQSAHRIGRVTTLSGRIRVLAALEEPKDTFLALGVRDANVRSRSQEVKQHFAVAKAERQAVNTVIQGSAAEIAKSAMLTIERRLAGQIGRFQCHLVLHEHDELLYEIAPAQAAREIGSLIRIAMSSVGSRYKLTVPLPVKLRAGQNWSQLEEVTW